MNSLESRLHWRISRAIEVPLWWLARKAYGTKVEGMPFVDGRVGRENDGVQSTLAAALRLIPEAGSEFNHLVRRELTFIAGVPMRTERVAPWLRSYSSPFRGFEATNVQYLATRLVWAAAYCRAYRLTTPHPTCIPDADAREQAAAAQLEFVARLPNAEAWTTYLRDQALRTGSPRRPPGS